MSDISDRNIENASKNNNAQVTLDDVARLAGVSPATVSRCINAPESVRAERRLRVMNAIDQLGYVPNAAARALASSRTRMIGAVFPSLDSTLFGGMLEALQSEISAAGYTLVVASSGYDPERELQDVRNLISSGIDALTLVGAARDPRVYDVINRKNIPYVLNWVSSATGGHPCIGFDNHSAGNRVARYLLELGHDRFGMISGRFENNDRASSRRDGICDALAERGISLDPDAVVECPFGIEEGRRAFRSLMSRPTPPTAIICGSDTFAYGSIFEAHDLGVDIPSDVSITGFDDMWMAAQTRPTLTTLQTPRREIGIEVGRYLLSQLSGTSTTDPSPLKTQLIVRDSTGPAKSK